MIIYSVASPNGRYRELAQKLLDSCKRFSIPTRIHLMPDQGDRIKNCALKAEALLAGLMTTRGRVCWMDADCTVERYPELLVHGAYDLAVYNWRSDPENSLQLPADNAALKSSTGVIAFDYTAPAIELLTRWHDRLQRSPIGDDLALDEVFNQNRPPVRPVWLPKSYNRMARMWPDVAPIINHDWIDGGHANAPQEAKAQ
jgi:hypothetical protein